MSNLTEIARRIKAGAGPGGGRWELGTVAPTAPLTVALLGGEIMATAPLLKLTASAAERSYAPGDEVICLTAKSGIVLLDRMVRE